MQVARDNSIPKFCRFYPSHEQSTDLITNHYRSGVFWHPYESSRARSIRDAVNFPLHESASAQETPPDFSLHVLRSGRERVSFSKQLLDAEMQYTSPFYIERTRFDEFADYEMAYGNNRVPRWHIRAYEPSGQSLLPRVRSARATPTSNPEAYVRAVLDGFVRFADPTDRMTRDDWLDFLDLEQSRLSAQVSRDIDPVEDNYMLGSLLAAQARRHRLDANNLAASMKLIAETVVAYQILKRQAPTLRGIGIDSKTIASDLFELGGLIGNMLDVRRNYIADGDIPVDEEWLAGFDSRKDLGEEVDEVPSNEKLGIDLSDLNTVDFVRLNRFVDDITYDPNALNILEARRDVLDALKSPTEVERKERIAVARSIAKLRDAGLKPVVKTAKKTIADAERAKVEIAREMKDLENDEPQAKADSEAAQLIVTNLDNKIKAGGPQKTIEQLKLDLVKAIQTKFRADLEYTRITSQKKANFKKSQKILSELSVIVGTLNDQIKVTLIPESARRKLSPTVRTGQVYQRAVSLVTVDLVETELQRMKFLPPDKELKKLDQVEQTKLSQREAVRKEQVADAIATIENVRNQLRPSNSIDKLVAVAGRGTLPFAEASMQKEKPMLTKNELVNYQPSSDASRALDLLFA